MPNKKEESALTLLLNIDHADKQIAGFKQRIETERKTRRGHLDLLAAKVKAGDSTGDKLVDFLACHPDLMASTDFHEGPVAQYLKELDLNIKACRGEPIFIVRSKKGDFGLGIQYMFAVSGGLIGSQGCIPPFSHSRWHYAVTFGILDCAELNFDLAVPDMSVSLPHCYHLQSNESVIQSAPEKFKDYNENSTKGSFELVLPPFNELIQSKLFSKTWFGDIDGLSEQWKVIVGRVAVSDWLRTCGDYSLKIQLGDWLEKVINIQPNES